MRSLQIALLSLVIWFTSTTVAQNRYSLDHPAGQVDRTVPLDLGGGQTCYASMINYSGDSSHVELFWTTTDQLVTNARSHRLNTLMSYMHDAARMNGGFLVCGSSDAAPPFLLKTDPNGDVQWYIGFPGLSFSQDRLASVIAEGGTFRAYSAPLSIANGFHRIAGDSAGTTFSGVTVSVPATIEFTAFSATAVNGGDIVFGQGVVAANPNNRRMFVTKMDSLGAQWLKLFDMDGASGYNEYVRDTEALADGGTLVVGHAADGGVGANGFVMKLDAAGGLLWCRKYMDTSGALALTGAMELPGGDLLVAGWKDLFAPLVVLRLSPTGSIIAQEQLPIGFPQPEDFFRNDQGGLALMEKDMLMELDATGSGCGFVSKTSIADAVHVPLITDVAVTNSSFVPGTITLLHDDRPPVLSWIPECLSTGIAQPAVPVLTVQPNPSEGIVTIGAPGEVAWSEPIMLLDAMGKVVFGGRYGSGIDLSGLTPGVYTCSLWQRGIRVRMIRR
ncbi:MAG: T9SS type A sorting domain-containing protein [Flavobacteriales bacterium]|nr:T9SS type A sorting domain-containing protein [Flavobacteriales bacterium]